VFLARHLEQTIGSPDLALVATPPRRARPYSLGGLGVGLGLAAMGAPRTHTGG